MSSGRGKLRATARKTMPSTSRRREPQKRTVVEILSDSEDEAVPPRRNAGGDGAEAVSPGIRAMENLFKRIRRDTLRRSPRTKADLSSSESGSEKEQESDLMLTQVLEGNQNFTRPDNEKVRERSSSLDSNETLILPRPGRASPRRRSPATMLPPEISVKTEPSSAAAERKTTKSNPLRTAPQKLSTEQAELKPPGNKDSVSKRIPPGKTQAKRIAHVKTEVVIISPEKTVTNRLPLKKNNEEVELGRIIEEVPVKAKLEQRSPKLGMREPKPGTSLRDATKTKVQPEKRLASELFEPIAAVVSHAPFDINVQLNGKIRAKKPPTERKTTLKRLSKSPLKMKKQQRPVRKAPLKKKREIKPATVIKVEPETPSLTNKIRAPENTVADSIDVDDQIVSPLMSDGLWDIHEVISKRCSTNYTLVKSIIGMVEKGFTLPFICRYRRDQSGGLSPEVIQFIREEYLTLIEVRKKAKALVTKLDNEGSRDEELKHAILSSRTLEELNLVMEPFKQKGRKTHAARARGIGVEELAMPIWRGEKTLGDFNLMTFVDGSTPGKADVSDLMHSIRYILADELRKSRKVLDRMEEISRLEVEIHVKQKKTKASSSIPDKESSNNFRDYFDFVRKVSAMESHQIMAINRGEHLGFLSVSIHLLPFFEKNFKQCLAQQFHSRCFLDSKTKTLVIDAVDDSCERLCKPYISRVARAHLKDRAEKEALIVFSANLRALLMTPPVRGESVLGIDPGFAKGCKLAVISKSGDLLESDMMYLDNRPELVLTYLVKKYKCGLIAVGDGKGGQEVKSLITSCNERKLFGEQPVRFTTVREAGVSIYSVSKAAEEELPGLDCFVRGAVAIARRLQDPLVEFIKVEPKNLGIGMYQHDINESRLKEALQSTVVECVSYVGVDINVCPEFLLRQVAGLNATAAKNIIAYRKQHGPFRNREQLQMVPHIGPKRYEQCAGFVKILPETLKQCLDESLIVLKVQKPNEKAISEELEPLDTTIIHPESYGLTRRIIFDLGLDVKNIGSQKFIDTVTARAKVDFFAQKFDASSLTVELILKALKARRNWDVRDEGSAPIFCAGSITMKSIKIGQKVSGRVENVVPFGAFVDIAMDKDGLIPTRSLGAARGIIKLGDIVECRVIQKDLARKRITLAFESFK